MAQASGEVIDTPTQVMPFRAVIFVEGQIIQERFFNSRFEAETYIAEKLNEWERLAKDDGQVQ